MAEKAAAPEGICCAAASGADRIHRAEYRVLFAVALVQHPVAGHRFLYRSAPDHAQPAQRNL